MTNQKPFQHRAKMCKLPLSFVFRANLKDYLRELYFIPDIPELRTVNEVLRKYTKVTHE